LEKLEEGEYETQFGKVSISRTDGGYKIVVHVSEKALGKNTVKQMLQPLLAPAGENPV
jgi:hypothetical protein